ncbi:hypothetical protein [Myxosarcina sp. GI1]|uniref:hypothetical protein n=1 Tax=Myxosarcina sp. GI1 TaxID=1541065 RepID=UPI00056498BD|nr:hypothetical protein [Myxosarcina sp. GI1]
MNDTEKTDNSSDRQKVKDGNGRKNPKNIKNGENNDFSIATDRERLAQEKVYKLSDFEATRRLKKLYGKYGEIADKVSKNPNSLD